MYCFLGGGKDISKILIAKVKTMILHILQMEEIWLLTSSVLLVLITEFLVVGLQCSFCYSRSGSSRRRKEFWREIFIYHHLRRFLSPFQLLPDIFLISKYFTNLI